MPSETDRWECPNPPEVSRALDHVRSRFPEVTHLVITREAHWIFMTDEGNAPGFDREIDQEVIEAAADAVADVPAVFCVEN